jgi:hypothetical protein
VPTLPSTARRATLVAGAALALVAAGCGGSSSRGDADGDPASVLPANSPFYAEATVRPEGDLKNDVVAIAKRISRMDDPFGAIIKSIEDDDGEVTFKDDIEPWLGDRVGVAITSLRDLDNPDFAVAITTSDTDDAFDALKKDFDGREGEYEGVKFLDDDGTLGGVVGDMLVIGTAGGFRAAVDAEGADKQLDDSKGLADVRGTIDEDESIGYAFIDIEKGLDAALASQPLIASQIGPLKQALGGATTAGAALSVDDGAIRVEAVQVGGPKPQTSGDPSAALAGLPGDTVLGAGLGTVGSTLEQAVDQVLGAGPIAGQDPKAVLQTFERQLGITLKDDLLSWMGEGAAFVQGGSIANLGGGLVVTSTDPAKTKATLTKLVPLLRSTGVQVVDTPPAGATDGFRIGLGNTGVSGLELLVGLRENRFVVGANPAVVRSILTGDQQGRLGDAPAFKDAASKLSDGIKPSFYLDVPAIVQFATLALGSQREFQQAKPYLDAFSAMVAGAKQDGTSTRSQLVIGVK